MKPFDFINSITYKKNIAMDSNNESGYNPFITNRALSQFVDCILLSNEMNMRHHIDNKLQYDYFINRIRSKKRFKKWDKKLDNENIELIKVMRVDLWFKWLKTCFFQDFSTNYNKRVICLKKDSKPF